MLGYITNMENEIKVGSKVRRKNYPWTFHTVVKMYDVISTDGIKRTIVEFPTHPRNRYSSSGWAFITAVRLAK